MRKNTALYMDDSYRRNKGMAEDLILFREFKKRYPNLKWEDIRIITPSRLMLESGEILYLNV